jgi:hypothetical protein
MFSFGVLGKHEALKHIPKVSCCLKSFESRAILNVLTLGQLVPQRYKSFLLAPNISGILPGSSI